MKKLLTFIILFITFNSYAQTTEPITNSENITTAERIIDKYSGKIYDLVVEMAESLSVPAEYLWKVLVRQAIVESIVYIILLLLGTYFIYLFYNFLTKIEKWRWDYNFQGDVPSDKDNNSVAGRFTVKILIGIAGVVMFLTGIFHIEVIVQGIVNPEYKAIEMIIEALNGR